MDRVVLLEAACLGLGTAMVIGSTRLGRQARLADRLLAYLPARRGPALSREAGFGELWRWAAARAANRLAVAIGFDEELPHRLARLHIQADPTAFRIRELVWSAGALGACSVLSSLPRMSPLLAAVLAMAGGITAFIAQEQRLTKKIKDRQDRVFYELPVVEEHLAMLLGAGFSLGAAIARIAARTRGAISEDLAMVRARILHGISESKALEEWAELAGVEGVVRLVAILRLHQEAADLARLVSEEAKAQRREVQRAITEVMERRAQQVWIPVTVSALVPGVVFLLVPFIAALHAFAAT